jgi:uncharacterized protein YdhG (YjbR/CyaY superfamily)
MRNYIAENVDDYIKGAEPEARPTLIELRKIVKSTVPKVEEGISWGVPFYKFHGLLAGFSSFTNHASFGLAFALDENVRKELEEKGYKTGSKTVQIRFDQKVPEAEIKLFLFKKAKQNQAKKNDNIERQ